MLKAILIHQIFRHVTYADGLHESPLDEIICIEKTNWINSLLLQEYDTAGTSDCGIKVSGQHVSQVLRRPLDIAIYHQLG